MTGQEVCGLRARLGWSQARLARALDVHRSSVCRWEKLRHQPKPACIARMQELAAHLAEGLALRPVSLQAAFDFIARHHRHHPPPPGAKLAVGATLGRQLVGVATIGRPVSRRLDDGFTAEVTRVATDGTENACSFLLGAAWRVSKATGYRRLITYTLAEEPGTSLRAAGWRAVAQTRGGSWSAPSRPRRDKHPVCPKVRWEVASGALPGSSASCRSLSSAKPIASDL